MVGAATGPVGRDAEERAFRFLCGHGLRPVERNFRTRRGEIDLVMLDRDCLVFVEVRARGAGSFVHACQTVDRRKQAKLVRAAMSYLSCRPRFRLHACRFDVLGVDLDAAGQESFDWIRDAFRPEG